jgi:hypothetical protein
MVGAALEIRSMDDDKPPSRRWGSKLQALAAAGVLGILVGLATLGVADALTFGPALPKSAEWTGFALMGAVALVGLIGSAIERWSN